MKSIRRYLLWSFVAGSAALWTVGGVSVYLAVRHTLLASFDGRLLAQAQAMATLTEEDLGLEFEQPASSLWPEAPNAPGLFALWDSRGNLVHGASETRQFLGPEAFQARDREGAHFLEARLESGHPARAIVLRFQPRHETNGPSAGLATVVMVADRSELDRFFRLLTAILVGTEAMFVAGIFLLMPQILRKGLDPLGLVAAHAAEIDADALDRRFPTEGMPQELQPICFRLNDLLERLQRSFERERTFSADVAHELRTPIAELRAAAEVALKWPDAGHADKAVRDALDIALQMESTVVRLLSLMRCEAGLLSLNPEPVEVAALVAECWHPLQPAAAAKQLEVTFEVPAGLRLSIDRELFRAIVSNLLNNGVEYAPVGSPIAVSAGRLPGEFSFEVTNVARDLEAGDLPKLFDRCWRKQHSRTGSTHLGIGLPLSRAFAVALGMQLSADLSPAQSLKVWLSGPCRSI